MRGVDNSRRVWRAASVICMVEGWDPHRKRSKQDVVLQHRAEEGLLVIITAQIQPSGLGQVAEGCVGWRQDGAAHIPVLEAT